METKKKITRLLRVAAIGAGVFGAVLCADAQNKRAKDYYKRYGYQYALEAMDRSELTQVKRDSLEQYLLMKASSHKMTGDYATASRYYQELSQLTEKPDYKLLSGQMLVSMGALEEAMDYFKAFDMQHGESDARGRNWLASSGRLVDGSFPVYQGVELRNAPFNSGAFDGQAVPYRDGYMFSSNREGRRDVFSNRVDIWTKARFFDLWEVSRKDGSPKGTLDDKYKMATPLRGKVNTKYHDSYHTFMPGQRSMLFTRDLYTGKKRFYDANKYTRLGIFSAQLEGDRWEKVESLPFNNQEFTHAHPALSHDGMRLYFSSNRPGGYGGMDLYVSRYRGGVWTAPENLGPDVNTAGNELFPFVHKDGTLFFSSDGHGGLGGLDIYRTRQAKESPWDVPQNVGSPINSNLDDFAFVLDPDGKSGTLTSNREGGRGGDDIYLFKVERALRENLAQEMYVFVYDRRTGKRIADVPVQLNGGGDEAVMATDDRGGFTMAYAPDMPQYKFGVDYEGYDPVRGDLRPKYNKLAGRMEYGIPLSPGASALAAKAPAGVTLLKGNVVNGNKPGVRIPYAQVFVLDKCTGETATITADGEGRFEFKLKCNCEYSMKGWKQEYLSEVVDLNFKSGLVPCEPGGVVRQDLALVSGKEWGTLAVGDEISFENIYYDFDKYYIREEASTDLQKLLALLENNPNAIVEIGSHTDARGSNEYNDKLSANRAKSVVQWLGKRGVSESRLKPRGYGETQLTNQCANNVRCTEEEHQRNRRTSFRVVGMNDGKSMDSQIKKYIKVDPCKGCPF